MNQKQRHSHAFQVAWDIAPDGTSLYRRHVLTHLHPVDPLKEHIHRLSPFTEAEKVKRGKF